jgi:hypothetical protein
VRDALGEKNAKFVIVLADGLVESMILGSDPDGAPLMPATRTWSEQAKRYADVLAAETNARLGRQLLRATAEEFAPDEVKWLRVERLGGQDPLAAIRDFMESPGRAILVLDLDWLEPTLRPNPEILMRLDPAPWEGGTGAAVIEAGRSTRQRRSGRLVGLESRANRANDVLTRDLTWVVSAAHASIDERLHGILAAATSSDASVLLTATSSTGLGQREAVGPAMGAALDVARVPVLLRVPGGRPGVDVAPRQWIRLESEWFAAGILLDTSSPRQPPRLYDRLLDPGEWYDRAVEYPALADSLREVLRDRLYGSEPVLVFRAGYEPVDLLLSSPAPIEVSTGSPKVHLEPGEVVRVRMPLGAENLMLGGFQVMSIAGEQFLLTEVVVHSDAWQGLAEGPTEGPELTAWME